MFKYFFLAAFGVLIFATAFGSTSNKFSSIPLTEDSKNFFASYRNSFVLHGEDAKLESIGLKKKSGALSDKERLVQIPVTMLKKFGIVQGSSIQHFKMNPYSASTYTFGEKVTVLLFGLEDEIFDRFSIILGDSEDVRSEALKERMSETIGQVYTYFAYLGESRKFSGQIELIPLSVSSNREVLELLHKAPNIKMADIGGYKFYIHSGESDRGQYHSGAVELASKKFVMIPSNHNIVSQDGKNLIIRRWEKDIFALEIIDAFTDEGFCQKFYVFERGSVSVFSPRCDG